MKTLHAAIELPDWVVDHITNQSQELGVHPNELVGALICSKIGDYRPHTARHFAVPASMEERMVGDKFMVISRNHDQVVLAPTKDVPFEQALTAFQANGLTEEQVLEVIET